MLWKPLSPTGKPRGFLLSWKLPLQQSKLITSQRQCEKQRGGQLEAVLSPLTTRPSYTSDDISGCLGCNANVIKVCPGCRQLPAWGGENPGLWMVLPAQTVPSLLCICEGIRSASPCPGRLCPWHTCCIPEPLQPHHPETLSQEELVWDRASSHLSCLVLAGSAESL